MGELKKKKRTRTLKDTLADVKEATHWSKLLKGDLEGGIERDSADYKPSDVTQEFILNESSRRVAKKALDLRLPLGPYKIDVTDNGSHLIAAGAKGQISSINLTNNNLVFNRSVGESTHDIEICFDESFFAVAQRKHLHVYDRDGVELHSFRHEHEARVLSYLPYHFLLVSNGEAGILRYRDISTGQFAGVHFTKRGPCSVMNANPWNGVVHCGHSKGTVTLWTPNVNKPVMEFLCHKGPITAVRPFNKTYMATAAQDGQYKIWDIRRNDICVNRYAYYGQAPKCIEASDTGLLAIGGCNHIMVWKDVDISNPKRPYLRHDWEGIRVESLKFRPFEDILFVGHSEGIKSLVVPGAGIAEFDLVENNPFATTRQKGSQVIRRLIQKLPPDTIILDPLGVFGKVTPAPNTEVLVGAGKPEPPNPFPLQTSLAL